MPSTTKTLIFMNMAFFALQMFFGDFLIANFSLWPAGRFRYEELHVEVGFKVWQLLSSAFLHANAVHLGLNMLGIYMFAPDVERTLGPGYFLALYISAVLVAASVQLALVTMTANAGVYPTIGASGGVFGILLVYGVLFPRRIIVLLFPPIPMPAKYFVVLYGLFELMNGVLGTEAGVAHFAHLGGMLGGFLVLRFWRLRNPG